MELAYFGVSFTLARVDRFAVGRKHGLLILGLDRLTAEKRLTALSTQPTVACYGAAYLWAATHTCLKALPLQSARNFVPLPLLGCVIVPHKRQRKIERLGAGSACQRNVCRCLVGLEIRGAELAAGTADLDADLAA